MSKSLAAPLARALSLALGASCSTVQPEAESDADPGAVNSSQQALATRRWAESSVFQSQNNNWFSRGYEKRVFSGDVNGDHMADSVGIDDNGQVWVSLATGEGFDWSEIWRGSDNVFAPYADWFDTDSWDRVWLADVTGDHKADLVGIAFDGSIWVAESTGSGFAWGHSAGTSTFTTPAYFGRSMQHRIFVADVNDDDRADIVGFASGGDIRVALATGSGTTATFADDALFLDDSVFDPGGGYFAITQNPRVWMGDVTGDGRADVVGMGWNGFLWVSESRDDADGFEPAHAMATVFQSDDGWFSASNSAKSSRPRAPEVACGAACARLRRRGMKSPLVAARSLVFLSCGALACSGAPGPPPADPAPPAATAVTAAPTATASAAPEPVSTAAPGPSERDPALMKLATAALTCAFDQEAGEFDEDCPAFDAWFQLGMGEPDSKVRHATLLSMLEDPDERVRVLAARPGLGDTGDFFNEPTRARRLVTVAKKETNTWVQHEVSHQVARIDAEKLGLAADLRELAKNRSLRVGLASGIAHHTTPLVLELARAFLDDPADTVRDAVALSLYPAGPGAPPYPEAVCTLIREQISRTDSRIGRLVFDVAARSGCPGLHEIVITTLTQRVEDPSKLTRPIGTGYALAAASTCERTTSADLKKKGYRILLALTGPKVTTPYLRYDALSFLPACDKAAARKALAALAKDKDAEVAEQAKTTLQALDDTK